MTANKELITTLGSLSTAVVSDALDRLGMVGQASGIIRIAGIGTVVGPAFTVHYVPVGLDGGSVGDYIDDVEPGSIVALDNSGRTDVTVWGGLLSEVAKSRGVIATVIDGICRDVARAHEVDYPLFARAKWMRTGKDRVRAEAIGVPISIGSLLVRPRDIVMGDEDGIVVVPAEKAELIVTTALEIEKAEEAIRVSAVVNGSRLDEARRMHGYHSLQTRRESSHGS